MSEQVAEKPKKRIRSKSKGNGFENVIAKKLSVALSPLKFIRTQGSGARVGGKNFEALGQMFGEEALKLFVGDVVPVNEKEAGMTFKHSIECKFYKTPDSFSQLVSGSSLVFKWMKESEDDAVKTGKIPLIIFKWNNTATYVGGYSGSLSEQPLLTLKQGNQSIDILLLEDLLLKPSFWCDRSLLVEANVV